MAGRVTRSGVTVLHGAGNARVTRSSAVVISSDSEQPVRVTRSGITTIAAERINPVWMTRSSLVLVRSSFDRLEFPLLSSGQLFTPDSIGEYFDNIQPPGDNNAELNPYRPYLPAEIEAGEPVLGKFLKEQIETLRQQHNLTQAGDTTYPWEVLTEVSPTKLFTLGSIGRFYHPEYGVIVARYVQFHRMIQTSWPNAPVGLMRNVTSVDWVVTNDFGRSRAEYCVGIAMLRAVPQNLSYGWAVIEGANVFSLFPMGVNDLRPGTGYTWTQTGAIGTSGRGRRIGEIWGDPRLPEIGPGKFFIKIETWSVGRIQALFSETLAALQTQLDSLEDIVQELEIAAGAGGFAGQITQIQFQLTQLRNRIAAEESTRNSQVINLQNQIDAIGNVDADLAALRDELMILIQANYDSLDPRITEALNRANEAYALAAANLNSSLQIQIDDINAQLLSIGQQIQSIPGVTLPLVTGEVPPVLMYLDDGSLVWTEI